MRGELGEVNIFVIEFRVIMSVRTLRLPDGNTYHTMGVLPSTQPVATLGSSFILSSFDYHTMRRRTSSYVSALVICWRK